MSSSHFNNSLANPARVVLPKHRQLYYGGKWQAASGTPVETFNPSTGESLGKTANANAEDVDAAVQASHAAFRSWRKTSPSVRAEALRKIADVLRTHADELAMIDALNCGNPVRDMRGDSFFAAAQLDLFAGLAIEAKGHTLPTQSGRSNYTIREPLGVCARILAYNHPLMFLAGKMAAPLAAGNTVIMKPPVQAPLSAYRFIELIDNILPPGVLSILTGGRECGEALVAHPKVPAVSLIGSVATGRSIATSAANRLKRVLLELGGKNALIIFPDADFEQAVAGAVAGMNFGWCGQSCGSTSRIFVHASIYDEFTEAVVKATSTYVPGVASSEQTNMGALISREHRDRVLSYIEKGKAEGARLLLGGRAPHNPDLENGFFVEPTIFGDVNSSMTIAREEIFGPVLSILKWNNVDEMYEEVNGLDYGLTAAVYTSNLHNAHHAANELEAGSVSINSTGFHFLGAPFGGSKLSGVGREESIDELLEFTQIKSININYAS